MTVLIQRLKSTRRPSAVDSAFDSRMIKLSAEMGAPARKTGIFA